jgi:hypothetical protein
MIKGTAGEASDHPHHQSFWFDHGSVNGISFWHLGEDAGRIVTTKVNKVANQGAHASIEFENKWVDADDKVVCTDSQKMTFHNYRKAGDVEYAAIDYEITVKASHGDLTFGDTKEGSMGIRTHPGLRIDKGATAVPPTRVIPPGGMPGITVWSRPILTVSMTLKGNLPEQVT